MGINQPCTTDLMLLVKHSDMCGSTKKKVPDQSCVKSLKVIEVPVAMCTGVPR